MAKYGLVGVVMTILVGVILIGTLLAPTIEGIQETAGERVTYTNTSNSELLITDDVSGIHTFTMISPNNYMTVDGTVINSTDYTNGFYFVSDKVSVIYTGSVAVVYWGESSSSYNPNWGRSFDLTFDNGTATLKYTHENTTETFTYDYSWIGYRVDTGGNYVNKTSGASVYHNETMSDVVAMGYYTSGENDTFYVLKDGKLSIGDPETYTYSYTSPNATLVNGTTDVYNGTIQIAIGGETFTPYVWAAAKEVNGHADAGAAYTLYGVIVVIFIVVLFMVAARSLIFTERD